MKKLKTFSVSILIFLLVLNIIVNDIHACSRIVYNGLNGYVITARSMDWESDVMSNL